MKKLFAGLVILMISSGVRAQFIWNQVLGEDSQHGYSFEALGCWGNNCTVAGEEWDKIKNTYSLMFWRSTDNGTTWNKQDPNILYFSSGVNNYFTQVQQIDSLNVVAIGAFGLILRTFDGGTTWQKQDCKTTFDISVVDFSDSLTGIVTIYDGSDVLTTSDGGRHWNTIPVNLNASGFWQCHSFGNGEFSILKRPIGPIFTTKDSWKTFTTSSVIVDVDPTQSHFIFSFCKFVGEDTIITYAQFSDTINGVGAAITRTTDGGMHWDTPTMFFNGIWLVTNMTPISRDTILAGTLASNIILMSLDKGKSWRVDTIIFNVNFPKQNCMGLDWTGNNPIAVYGSQSKAFPSIIVQGKLAKSYVEFSSKILYNDRIFPNPASKILNIASVEEPKPFWIIDILGRTVLTGTTLDHTTLTVDISSLRAGVYDVISEGPLGKVIIGKLAVTDK